MFFGIVAAIENVALGLKLAARRIRDPALDRLSKDQGNNGSPGSPLRLLPGPPEGLGIAVF